MKYSTKKLNSVRTYYAMINEPINNSFSKLNIFFTFIIKIFNSSNITIDKLQQNKKDYLYTFSTVKNIMYRTIII